jgi:hypothetical protein
MVKHKCRICKKATDQRIVEEFSLRLPPYLYVLECQGCGVLGVEMLGEQHAIADS